MSTRDANGRFVKGHSGNPLGRPQNVMTLAARGKVTSEDAQAIMTKLLQLALEGDLRAIEMLWDRFEGKPMQSQHFTGEVTTQIREVVIRQPPQLLLNPVIEPDEAADVR